MINALSVDLEYWWSAEFFKKAKISDNKEDLIIESIIPLLGLFEQYHINATFFILGLVAMKYPEIVEKIHDQGHEIACHGYSHKPLYELGKQDFERELDLSIKYLSKFRPIGFRAPSFSLDNKTNWALRILSNKGFKYDSSLFPANIGFYGVANAPLCCYNPSNYNILVDDPNGRIKEIPLAVLRFGNISIPVAGGFYLRALPLRIFKMALNQINKERPAVIYIHPWETFVNLPRYDINYFYNWVNYYGIRSALNKLENLLKSFEFETLKEVFL